MRRRAMGAGTEWDNEMSGAKVEHCHEFDAIEPCATDDYRHACGRCGGDKRRPIRQVVTS